MAAATNVISHWYHLIEDFQTSAQEFYTTVELAIKKRQVPNVKVFRVDWKEGGVFSAKREYLRVQWKEYVFDICAAPFGTGFFFSWWLGEFQGCLSTFPFFSQFVRPETYYKIDTARMFQETIRHSVMEVIDALTTAKGIRALADEERKPVLHELYKR